jgi:hypothetical protein
VRVLRVWQIGVHISGIEVARREQLRAYRP